MHNGFSRQSIVNAHDRLTDKPDLSTLLRQSQGFVHVHRIRVNDTLPMIVYAEGFINLLGAWSVNIWVPGILAQAFPSLCAGFVKDEVLSLAIYINVCT